ncbi:myosin phosphatase Rho-interacting protein isoform X2 [Hippoglossus stenolepis]|uniref:myosin phosphatase Rho-interacting protein isoform X2 n=1 Tax=Hippoglossus stenolepis TaxID=195615 RepID=UPI001FAEC278|nr:myosin phosphatase Rho-interacting protein isoform X2 [Hippoglossus stenolepis]
MFVRDKAPRSMRRRRGGERSVFGELTAEQRFMSGNMSGEKASSPCNKFQANIFNKSKCQNCFKSRELHLMSDHDKEQAKPIYGGWLCLAPEGTDFDNPMQRSRKWQRRFFILYEHGSLRFALDELPSTLPQGTVNLNLCTEIADAEPRTGQRNALCIVTSEQEIFIRGDNKEIINGWSEQLSVYLRTNKQYQKKKRKVEPVATQEPSPAKMAATDPVQSSCGRWQEEQRGRGPDVTPIWTVTDTEAAGPEQTPADCASAFLCPVSRDPLTLDGDGHFGNPVLDSVANGNITQPVQASTNSKNQRQDRSGGRTERIVGLDVTNKEQEGGAAVSSRGRSEARNSKREKLNSCGDLTQLSAPPPQRRAKSLDRRTSDTVMTPDLLNFKKGWMVKLDEKDQWKKYWFVLSIDSLRFYKDSITEEASDLEGEIDLTRCYNVSEYQVQRNYGFQIHTLMAVYTLSAMTAGIRRNWIQSLMKNVHPVNTPDVTSLPGHHAPRSAPEALPKPDVTQDSRSTDVPTERDPHHKPRSVVERRREGRYKTYDWAEFRPQNKSMLESDHQRDKSPCSLELGELDRKRRREERRRRYENMLGFSLSWDKTGGKTDNGGVRALSPESQQRVEEEIEECWMQVEKTVFRLDRTVPLFTEAEDTVDMEKLLNGYRNGVEDLKLQLAESERHRLELEAQLSPVGDHHPQVTLTEPPLGPEEDFCPLDTNEDLSNCQTLSLKEAYEGTREVSQQQIIIAQDVTELLSLEPPLSTPQQTPSIWLHDTEGHFQELGDFLPEGVATPLFSPTSDSQCILSQSDGRLLELNSDDTTADHQRQLDREDSPLFPTTETQINNSEYNSIPCILGKPSEGDDSPVNCLIEQHIPPDQAMVRRLSQEVELLTSQNEALNQRNQEMLNQLTEADREIERLKAEVSSRYTEPHHLPEVEQQGNMRAEDLERELSLRNQELLEAQTLITSLTDNLRGTEAILQLDVDEEEAGGEKNDPKSEGYLLRCFEATEAKLTELEKQLNRSETNCGELHVQNAELKEAERFYHQRAAEAEADIRRLNQELEAERFRHEKKSVSGEERIRQVIEGMVVRLDALEKLLEAIGKLDYGKERENEETMPAMLSQLKWEEDFWSLLFNELRASTSQSNEEKCVEVLLREVAERMVVERQMLLLGHYLLSGNDSCTDEGREGVKDLDVIWNTASVTATETQRTDETRMFDSINQLCHIEHFKAATQMKMSLLNCVASAPEKLQLIAESCRDFHVSEHHWFGLIHSAATEALYCFHLQRLQSKCEKQLEETKRKLLNCSSCVKLIEENRELKARLSNLEEQQASTCGDTRNVCCQTDEISPQDTGMELQITQAGIVDKIGEEEMVASSLNCTDVPLLGTQEVSKENSEDSVESQQESDPNTEMEQVLVLRRRVKELEELLSVTVEEMSQEFEGKMICVQMQHEKETEKLKATCQRGFLSMEQSHLKVLEELQRRHQQEVERLLVERDQLLEEESSATATAIEAIKNAHRLELEREVQRRCQSENSNENNVLEIMQRQHSEELASYQRELEVLSQQFCLKCLENGHLVQALDAERRALCQCQQENQDLRTRNQELSSHLAAEITRLCSLAKQDELPFSQGMDIYEMEITLRVKESEVQCLKQEITSLKDELQSAQRDKRNATKKYKDMFTELSIVRAKSDSKVDELRENLRLAHHALDQTSP